MTQVLPQTAPTEKKPTPATSEVEALYPLKPCVSTVHFPHERERHGYSSTKKVLQLEKKCGELHVCVCARNLLLKMVQSKNRIHFICHLAISIQLISSVSLVFQIPRHHIVLPVNFQVGSCNLAKWLPPSLQSFFGLIPKWLNGVLKGLEDIRIRIGHEGF